MPYKKTKDGSLVNEVTLGDGYPLSNDLQPLKVGGEASPIEMSTSVPDGSDNGKVKVRGDLDITGTLKTKLSHDLIYDFDDEVNTLAQAKVDALIDSAPAALDTLNELAAALNDDASFATTVTNSLATKLNLSGGTLTGALEINGGSGTDLDPLLRINKDVDGDGSATGILIGAVYAGQSKSGIFFENKGLGAGRGNLYFCNDNTADTSDATIADARMTITNTGNVGIGTTSPQSALHVEEGDIRIDTAQNGTQALRFSDRNGTEGQLQYNSQYLKLRMLTDAADGTDTKRLTVLGGQDATAVGIGTDDPTTTLDVEGTVSYKSIGLSSSSDAFDVSGATTVTANSASGNIILGGFSNGVLGQIIHVIHRSPTNSLRFEHNEATATQRIYTSTSADKTLSGYGGMTLFCDGSNWFEIGN